MVLLVTRWSQFLSVLSQELAKYEECENQVTLTEKGEFLISSEALPALQVVLILSSRSQISWRMDLVKHHFTTVSLLKSRRRTERVRQDFPPSCN